MPRGKYKRTTEIRKKITGGKNPNFKNGLYCKKEDEKELSLREVVLEREIRRRQTETVYPLNEAPIKKWYGYVCGGQKRPHANPHYKERTPDEIIESVVNFTKEELKEAMIKVLKERGQSPKDWGFEKQLVAESVGI